MLKIASSRIVENKQNWRPRISDKQEMDVKFGEVDKLSHAFDY